MNSTISNFNKIVLATNFNNCVGEIVEVEGTRSSTCERRSKAPT